MPVEPLIPLTMEREVVDDHTGEYWTKIPSTDR